VIRLLIGLVLGLAIGAVASLAWRRTASRRTPTDDGARGRAELVSKISHELKNPIMSVKGLASTGSRLYGSMDDGERLELFRLIDVEAARLKLIADETSIALKIDAGALTYDARVEDVGAVVEESAWRTPVGDHPIRVSTEPGVVARVDRMRLAEVVATLVDNAAKFSPPGSPIEVRAGRGPDGTVEVSVRDEGPGIPDERKAEVRRRYSAWRPPGYEEVPGAGLGLYIAGAHVGALGGRMEIGDAEPSGTILRVWLPSGG
jgi:signal transduction histidine kinase